MNHFYIPKPCHEKWDHMRPESNGRHCAVCKKTVVDFTGQTPAEINTIINASESQVCGRFTFDQLDRQAQTKVLRNPWNLFNGNWKYFAMSVLGFLAFGKKSQAQEPLGGAPVYVDTTPGNNTDSIKLSGNVFRPDLKPASGAKITFSSNGHVIGETVSMANGTYVYRVPPGKISGNNIDITVYCKGYPLKRINHLEVSNKAAHLNIIMGDREKLMGIKKNAPANGGKQ